MKFPLFWRSPLAQLHPQQLWNAALGYLEVEIPRPNFETWLKDTTAVGFQGDKLVVGTKSAFAAEMLEKRLSSTISRAVERVAKKPTPVSFQVIDGNSALGAVPGTLPRAGTTGSISDDSWIRLNPMFTFKNFITGPSNELAHAAATAVAERPGRLYNPLYIWSETGLGKTHLVQAIAHELIESGLNVIYVSSERFTNEYIRAIREGSTEQFRERYRSTEALLIDDIQFIAGKEQTQEGFFHTFNELHMLGRQVVVTGDEPARKSLLEERIQSRLEGGLVVDIQPPDYETRVAILRNKADALGVTLSHDVLDLLARKQLANVRELEGCLNKIVAYAHLTRAPLTVETVSTMLVDMFAAGRQQPAKPEMVMDVVAEHFGVDVEVLCGRRRDKHTALARRVAMYLLREESGLSSTRIGNLLGGKDHSTVLYAQKRLESQVEQEPLLRQDLVHIRQTVSARKSG
ncbi:MAG: chromosomal replication initiator protein DnaA [Chloroflexi bacterium]|nr:chromosomal replication initiator protein DnaA [Chloroflexota bacterium]